MQTNEAIVQKMYVHRPPLVDSFLVPSCPCASVNERSSWRSITTDDPGLDPGWPRDDSGAIVGPVASGKTEWSRHSSLELLLSYFSDPVKNSP
jgi:hypothetical protein